MKMAQEKTTPKQAVQRISVLNYNLYCLPWLALMFAPSTCPLPSERVNHFLKHHINSYDVICLQEVWNPRYRNIERNAKKKGLHVVGSSSASFSRYLNLRVFGGGLMIISKYPIVETRECLYDKGTGSDGFVSKGVLYAKVQVAEDRFIHVFNTHLQASYGCEYKEHDPYANIRKDQITKIASFLEEVTCDDDHPILLMGDFNVNARRARDDGTDSEEYLHMMKSLNGDLFNIVDVLKESNKSTHPVTHEGSGVFVGDRVSHGGQRLDFLLDVRRKSTTRKDIKHKFLKTEVLTFEAEEKVFTQVSDHYGIHAVMELSNNAAEFVPERDEEGGYRLGSTSFSFSFAE